MRFIKNFQIAYIRRQTFMHLKVFTNYQGVNF